MKRSRMPVDTKHTSHLHPAEGGRTLQLPPVSLNSMTQGQLRDFIPNLLRIVTGKTAGKGSKPEWWPSDIPWSATRTDVKQEEAKWTETLRSIARQCYKYLGQESSLETRMIASSKSTRVDAKNYPLLQSYLRDSYRPSAIPGKKNSRKTYAEIYICFFCEKEFMDRNKMRDHQENCQERPPKLQAIRTPPRNTTLMRSPPTISPSPKLNLNTKLSRPTKEAFIKLHNLVPKLKAEKIRASHRKSLEIDCEKIDVDEPISPLSPTTPRTPKSLISQLSRDDSISTSKKRLSYSEPIDNSDKESVASGGNEDSEDKPGRSGKSLLTIDVSSLLGQRIQKHIQTEATVSVIPNAEQFCKTPEKNDVLGKLRNRTFIFPTTYRPRKRSDIKNVHQYQFTQKQKKDFMKRVSTGLSKNSQNIAKSIPKCQVLLRRLTDKQLKKWLSNHIYRNWKGIKRTKPVEESVFPKKPLLMSKDVDKLLGLKKKSGKSTAKKTRSSLSLVNVVSEDVNAETSKQKFTLYRCLLSDISTYSAFFDGQKLPMNSSNDSQTGCIKSTQNTSKKTSVQVKSSQLSPISYRQHRQNILNKKSDDDVSIMSISSDEESFKSSCCTGCRTRKYCRCTPDLLVSHSIVSPTVTSASQTCAAKLADSLSTTCTLPVDVPLKIMPYDSPDMSPCSCISSPCSDVDNSQKMFPSPSVLTTRSPNYIGLEDVCFSVKSLRHLNTESLLTTDSFRRTRSSVSNSPISELGTSLKSEGTRNSSKVSDMSVCNNKLLQQPLTDLNFQIDISLPSSPSSSSISSRDSPISLKRKEVADHMLESAVQRQSPRSFRSDSVGDVFNLNTPKSPNSLVRKSSSFTPLCLRSGSVSNAELHHENSPKKGSLKSQTNIFSARRSKRLLSSPASSPSKLRRIETT